MYCYNTRVISTHVVMFNQGHILEVCFKVPEVFSHPNFTSIGYFVK